MFISYRASLQPVIQRCICAIKGSDIMRFGNGAGGAYSHGALRVMRLRNWALTRMLYCPERSPLSTSRRLPGGTLRSSSRAAISNCLSLRRATLAICIRHLTRPPFEIASVSENGASHCSIRIKGTKSSRRTLQPKNGVSLCRPIHMSIIPASRLSKLSSELATPQYWGIPVRIR